MSTITKYDEVLRNRAQRLVADARRVEPSLSVSAAAKEIGPLLGVNPSTLRAWCRATDPATTPESVIVQQTRLDAPCPTTSGDARWWRRPESRYLMVRVAFGVIWGIDATLKWLPGVRDQFLSLVRAASQGQPSWLDWWFHLWIHVMRPAPEFFSVLVALTETGICLMLLFGVLQRVGFVFGAGFAFMIWAIGEGFGGPYMSGSTDIGCAIMYTFAFVILLLAVPGQTRADAPSLDRRIVQRWPRLSPLTFQHQQESAPGRAPAPSTASAPEALIGHSSAGR